MQRKPARKTFPLAPKNNSSNTVLLWEVRWPHGSHARLHIEQSRFDIALCSWVGHFTLTVPLSSQVYKWVQVNLMLGVTLQWTSIPSSPGGAEILLVTSCYRNWRSSGFMGHLAVCRLNHYLPTVLVPQFGIFLKICIRKTSLSLWSQNRQNPLA